MAGIDWGSVASTNNTGWSAGGGTSKLPTQYIPKNSKPSGGGGLLGSIEHAVESLPGSNVASNVLHTAGHGAADVGNFFGQMGVGLWDTGLALQQDTINHPLSALGLAAGGPFGSAAAASAMSHLEGGHGTNFEKKVARPVAQSYSNKYAPIFQHPLTGKSYHGVENDPFGTALDVATIATTPFDAGASLGLRAATLGVDVGRAAELARIAELSTDAERASALAKLGDVTAKQRLFVKLKAAQNPIERTVQSGEDGRAVPYTVKPAKTPWGKVAQRAVLSARESPALRDAPIIGANRVAIKQGVADLNDAQMAGRSAFAKSQKAFNDLSQNEQTALHIIAEAPRGLDRGEWLATKIHSLETLLKEAKTDGARSDIQRQLDNLGANDPKRFEQIHDAIVNPSQKVVKARDAARSAADEIMKNLGVDEKTAMDRVYGPAAVQGGARWQNARTVKVPGADLHTEARAAASDALKETTLRYQRAQSAFRKLSRPDDWVAHDRLAKLEEEITNLKAQIKANGDVHEMRGQNPGLRASRRSLEDELKRREAHLGRATAKRQATRQAAYAAAEKELHAARQAYRDAGETLRKVPGPERDSFIQTQGELQGGPRIDALRNAPADAVHGDAFYFPHRGPQMQTAPGLSSFSSNMPLGEIKADAGQKLWKAVRQTTGSYVTNPAVWTRAGMSSLRWKLAHDYQQWLLDTVAMHPPGDELPKGYSWFQPTAVKADRAMKERTALHDSLDSAGTAHNADLEDAVKQMLPHGKNARLDGEHPVYIVPTKYADAMRQEFQRTNTVFHYMFEKPMDFWRAAVLKLRPAWLVNNIVGQHLLYWITADPGAAGAYFRALKQEKSGYYVDNLVGRLMKIPAFRNKYGAALEDAGVHGVGYGTTQGTLGDAREAQFMTTTRTKLREEHRAVYGTGSTVGKIVTAWPRFTVRANQAVADDWTRLARFQSEARKTGAALRVQAAQKALGEPMSYLSKLLGGKEYDAKIVNEMTADEKRQVFEKVDRALGNFNTLTPFERKYMRRIFPFYAWFKVIGAVSKDLLIDSPLRVNIIYNLEKAAQENPDLIPQSQLPSWLQGAISLGPTKHGVQPMLATTGLNPFNTIPQLAGGGLGAVRSGNTGLSSTTGLFGPALGAVDLFQGIDPFTGGTYKGAGANQSPLLRAIIGSAASLPEVSLLQSHGYLGGKAPSKSYAPETHHIGPLSLNDTDLGFLGYPRKNVRVAKAKGYAKLGY